MGVSAEIRTLLHRMLLRLVPQLKLVLSWTRVHVMALVPMTFTTSWMELPTSAYSASQSVRLHGCMLRTGSTVHAALQSLASQKVSLRHWSWQSSAIGCEVGSLVIYLSESNVSMFLGYFQPVNATFR